MEQGTSRQDVSRFSWSGTFFFYCGVRLFITVSWHLPTDYILIHEGRF
jgi:hypothetical protein